MEAQSKSRFPLKYLVLLAISLFLGGVGVLFSKQFIEDKINFYRSQMKATEEVVEIVVPKANLRRGVVVTSQNFALREFPKKYIDSNTVTRSTFNIAVGQKLNFDIDEGKPLLWAHLEGGVTPTFSGRIEDGRRALTVPVDEINSISGFLQPGDNVDLMLTYDNPNVKGGRETFPFMQNLKVMATGVKTSVDKTGRASQQRFSTITVHVTPDDAKKIIIAQVSGKITAMLRHPDDALPMENDSTTVADLFNRKPAAPQPVVRRRPAPKPGIDFIVGGR